MDMMEDLALQLKKHRQPNEKNMINEKRTTEELWKSGNMGARLVGASAVGLKSKNHQKRLKAKPSSTRIYRPQIHCFLEDYYAVR